MTQIKLNTALGGHAAGDSIEVTPKAAEMLIANGQAEPVEAKAKATRAPARKAVDNTPKARDKAVENPMDNGVGGASPDADRQTAG